jgi:ATP-dependent RNA helicase DDX18/HAS1
VDKLKAVDIGVEEFDFPRKKLINVQSQIEKLVSKNFELHQMAMDGFRLVSIMPLCQLNTFP